MLKVKAFAKNCDFSKADQNHCEVMVDISEKNNAQFDGLEVDLKKNQVPENNGKCGSTDQIRKSIINIKVFNKDRIIKRLSQPYIKETESFTNFKQEFTHLLINDHYSVKKDDFKLYLLPRLLKLSNSNPKIQSCAVILLEKILLDDWKLQNAELTLIAIKANLIPQLIKIYEDNNDLELRQSIYRFYLLLFFVIANDYKKVRNSILKSEKLLTLTTTAIIRNLNQTNDPQIIKDALLLLQFFPIWSQNFEIISPILSSLIKFIKHFDKSIVSQALYTLLIFSQNSKNTRFAIIKSSKFGELVELLVNCDSVHYNSDEDVIQPIMGLIMTLMPLSNRYKNEFLNANILSIIPKYINSCECQKRYACDIVKFVSLNPICSKLDRPTKQIQQLIDSKTILFIYDLLENDPIPDVKLSALNAIFVIVYESVYLQLTELAGQGCLKSLCTQLDSLDYKYLYQTLITIYIFLFLEFKNILANVKIFPNPKKCLTDFAVIISKSDGIRKLQSIVEREKHVLKENPYNRESENVRIIAEEMLIHAFGIETRHYKRIPSNEVMKYKRSYGDCVTCLLSMADTMLFPCEHVVLCHKCAAKALYKIYVSEKINQCPQCKTAIPLLDAPWAMFKAKPALMYKEIEEKIIIESK